MNQTTCLGVKLYDRLIVFKESFKMEKRLAAIVSGFKNYMFPNKEMEEVALQRALICAACPLAEVTILKQLLSDVNIKEIEGLKCSVCGCILSAKVRQAYESCPKEKW